MKNPAFIFILFFLGTHISISAQQEPACACNNAEMILSLSGKNLLYKEVSIDILNDNSILFRDGISGKYYKFRAGVLKGPLGENDPEIVSYTNPENLDPNYVKYREFISKTGDKYLISFKGVTYGPYYEISRFYVTKTGEKFMAVVSEKESLGLRLEKLNQQITAATTDKEKEELQARHVKLVQDELASGDDPSKYVKVISNIQGIKYNHESSNQVDTEAKFDEIVEFIYDDNGQLTVNTLTGKKLATIKPDLASAERIFINSANTKYAVYGFGTLTFGDGTSKSELFNPYLTSANGKIFLAYLYYSPVKNAIMQCKIEF